MLLVLECLEVWVTAGIRGVAALLGGHVKGSNLGRFWASVEPGHEGGLGVPALVLGTFTSALHAVTAAVLVITSEPETLPESDITLLVIFVGSVGGSVCWTCGPEGGGDLSTGTAGISFDLCPLSLPVGVHSCSYGMLGTFTVDGDGLPIPGIDFLEDFPLLTLAVLANFELANSLWVSFGGLHFSLWYW